MQLATILLEGKEQPILLKEQHAILVRDLNNYTKSNFPLNLMALLEISMINKLKQVLEAVDWSHIAKLSLEDLYFVAPYRQVQHIIGVGMNYVEKAEDLQAIPVKDAPVCFLKPTSSLIGMNEKIELPAISKDVTAEAELSLIVGKTCHQVSEGEAMSYIVGYTTSLDMTAKDIHAQNPRFLQMSKLCKTFFSFGPQINIIEDIMDFSTMAVQTIKNGAIQHSNTVQNMIYSPAFIVSYISQFITLQPGDIIMTGTPGSFSLSTGDIASCHIPGLPILSNTVG